MKKIVDDKLYDTETAKELFTIKAKYSEYTSASFCKYETKYYQKKNGEYFVVYHRDYEPMLLPAKKEEVLRAAEHNLSSDEYINAFGPRME